MIHTYDERRKIAIPGDTDATLDFCVEHFLETAEKAIHTHGTFAVALSGGSTPKAIFQKLATHANRIDWSKVMLFWSDERSVPANHPDSNYKMAMDAGFSSLPIPPQHIFGMQGEGDIESNALIYEKTLKEKLPSGKFDLVMLGMGGDGHTASLFPHTDALHVQNRLAVANYVPQQETWRMTLTYECINAADHIAIYVLGANKVPMLKHVFTAPYEPDVLPIQKIGTAANPALWITDQSLPELC